MIYTVPRFGDEDRADHRWSNSLNGLLPAAIHSIASSSIFLSNCSGVDDGQKLAELYRWEEGGSYISINKQGGS